MVSRRRPDLLPARLPPALRAPCAALAGLAAVATLASCKQSAGVPAEPAPTPLGSRELLIRLSLDLRGVRPSIAEYEAVEADPAELDRLAAEFLLDPRFGRRVREMFAPAFGTRIDLYPVGAADYGLPEEQNAAFQRSVGEEALRILSTVAEEDLPYTDLVTADWTMADENLGAAWPLDYPAAGTGWRKARYTDERPAAGILATNSLWWRYMSNGVNYNRGRANAISRILLCHDYLSRPVSFPRDVDLTDEALVLDAVRNNPGCVNCHVSLDPLGSYLFGFSYSDPYSTSEVTRYHPEREPMWQEATGVEPGWFGTPGYTLRDLGQQVAGDSRFVDCAAERVYEAMLRRDSSVDDRDALTLHREAFLQGGLTLRALYASLLDDPRYRAADSAGGGSSKKLLTPEQLSSALEDLSGYRFDVGGYEMLENDLFGLRSLAGGSDGYSLSEAARSPTPTLVLVHERVAEAAAWVAVQQEVEEPGSGTLFPSGLPDDPESEQGRAAMAAAIQHLHRRIFGTEPAANSEEVQSLVELWQDVRDVGEDAPSAWASVLSVLLRDPDFVLY
jgi:hypothetical protein